MESSTNPRSSIRQWFVPGLVGALGLMIMLALWVVIFGQVHGTELATDTFQLRRYRFVRLPLIGWQIAPAVLEPVPNGLVGYLASQKLLPKGNTRWDVVFGQAGGQYQSGDAVILANYLDMTETNGKQIWLSWSKRHPERAKQLWPAVQEAADLRAYDLVPNLFEIASRIEAQASIDEFETTFHRQIARQYAALARDDAAAKQYEQARIRYEVASKYDPQHQPFKQALQELRGKTDDSPLSH